MDNLAELIGFFLWSGGPLALAIFGALIVVVGVGIAYLMTWWSLRGM